MEGRPEDLLADPEAPVERRSLNGSGIPIERRSNARRRTTDWSGGVTTRILGDPAEPSPGGRGAQAAFLPGAKTARRDFSLPIKIALLAMGAAGIALVYAFFLLGPSDSPAAPAPSPPKEAGSSYAETRLASDLGNLRAAYSGQPQVDKLVEHQGPETRVYAHLASVLSPGSCPGSAAVRVVSADPVAGLSLFGLCGSQEATPGELSLAWKGRDTVATMFVGDREAAVSIPEEGL